jgi:hypothetical protein
MRRRTVVVQGDLMNGGFVICDTDILRQLEAKHLEQLRNDPGNLDVRLGLAWCLFMHALHQSGKESMLSTLRSMEIPIDLDSLPQRALTYDSEAYRLLKDSLHETFTVIQLDPQQEANEDVARLHALVRLSGAEQVFREAEDEATYVLARLIRDIVRGENEEPPS